MTNENPYKVLDDVLSVILNNKYLATHEIMYDLKETKKEFDMMYFEPALEKLHKEGYLLRKEHEETYNEKVSIVYSYKLSFEAILLNKNGGYVKKISDQVYENTQMKTLTSQSLDLNKEVVFLQTKMNHLTS